MIYLVLGDLLNPSFALRLDDGTDCCSALVVGRALNSFSPPKLSMRRKVADKRHLTLERISSATSLRVIKLTGDILLACLLLQCGDISVNPGPDFKLTCTQCSKTLRRNQGRGLSRLCKSHYHLKCLDVDFEKTKLFCLCSLGSVSEITSYVEFTSPKVELHPDQLNVLKTRGLKIAHLNIRSLPKKIDELRLFLRRCRDIGILTLNETWLYDQLPSDEVAIPGFNLFRRDRSSGRKGGGIAIYISDKIPAVRRCDLKDIALENLWLELMFPKSKGILLGTCYRPPDDSQFLEIFKLG